MQHSERAKHRRAKPGYLGGLCFSLHRAKERRYCEKPANRIFLTRVMISGNGDLVLQRIWEFTRTQL